jgi:hypothetical protein
LAIAITSPGLLWLGKMELLITEHLLGLSYGSPLVISRSQSRETHCISLRVALAKVGVCWGLVPSGVPLDVALDTPGRAWTTSATAPWFGQNFDAHDGVDTVRSGGEGVGEESWLETTIIGPTRVDGWVRNEGGFFEMRMDGVKVWGPRTNDWTAFVVRVPTGSHQVRLVHALQGGNATVRGMGCLVDQMVVTPITETSLSTAMDFGNAQTVWRAPGSVAQGYQDAAEVGAVGGDYVAVRTTTPTGGRPALEMEITGPARIRFRWQVTFAPIPLPFLIFLVLKPCTLTATPVLSVFFCFFRQNLTEH